MSDAAAFDDFWTASTLDRLTRRAFAERLGGYATAPDAAGAWGIDPWSQPGPTTELDRPAGAPHLEAGRRSTRTFGPGGIDLADLGTLLAALTVDDEGRRGYPAAGGLYTIRAAVLVFRGDAAGRVLLHDPVRHAVTDVGPCPDWPELRDDLAGQDAVTAPAAVLALFAAPGPITEKYGERGGRFLLIEAGAVAQTLSLTAARLGLAGFLLGGQLDARLLALANLTSTDARYVVGYAVGRPPERPVSG